MDLQQPQWSLDDAYGHVEDPRFQSALSQLKTDIQQLEELPQTSLKSYLLQRDIIETNLTSLQAFCKCCVSANNKDTTAASYASQLAQLQAGLEITAGCFEEALLNLSQQQLSDLLEDPEIQHWQFTLQQKRSHWKQQLTTREKQLYEKLNSSNLIPLANTYAQLANQMQLNVTNSTGASRTINNAAVIGILKGSDDAQLRATTFAQQNTYIENNKQLYANTLNAMTGFRLNWFEQAGVDLLTPSTHQNGLSNATLEAMMTALKAHRHLGQKAIKLRASYFNGKAMNVCDLLAPAPAIFSGSSSTFTFSEAIDTVKTALADVDQELADFTQMMVDNRWIEASVSDHKTGGAFYTRFNALKQPRVYSTFVGTLANITQQAHELGHAFHYWIMRDLPVQQTEFPMTLTESASTFNENQVRDFLLQTAESKAERFAMLWQELKTIANFLLNIPVRYDFEHRFLEQRKQGALSADQISELMSDSWRTWYGDSTVDTDSKLWASKLHFFKADQYIYNYPYSFGYLFSIGLLMKKDEMGTDFYPFYKAMLRDTGRMTVEALFHKHMGIDSTQPEFWNQCIAYLSRKVDLFEAEFSYATNESQNIA